MSVFVDAVVQQYVNHRSTIMNYGNYCGPGWTGGEYTTPGEKSDFSAPFVNELDAACKIHDKAYENAKSIQDRLVADEQLIEAVKQLHDQGLLPDAEARQYASDLIAAFTIKMAWMRFQIALGHLEKPRFLPAGKITTS